MYTLLSYFLVKLSEYRLTNLGHFNFIEFPQIYCVLFFFFFCVYVSTGSRRYIRYRFVACIDLSFVYSLFALFIGTSEPLYTYIGAIENSFRFFFLNIYINFMSVMCLRISLVFNKPSRHQTVVFIILMLITNIQLVVNSI